jgi:lipoprotein-anchoring transpeptidase ErfK/SrfK
MSRGNGASKTIPILEGGTQLNPGTVRRRVPVVLGKCALALAAFLTSAASTLAAPSTPESLTPEVVNVALSELVGPKSRGAAVLRAQVLLDRAHFSPGEIDAIYGSNTRKAIAAFQRNVGLNASGQTDAPTWEALNRDALPILVQYKTTAEDVAGPFVQVPEDMMEKSTLPALGYATPAEALGEKFHVSPKLLALLNPGKDLGSVGEGEDILVPSVEVAALPKATQVVVDKLDSTITLVDSLGHTVAHFPATIGSEHDPLPLGTWKINGISQNPVFHYNPDLFWDADPTHAKAEIKPGPNNPVGVVWIDLSKEHYGIHGTPEPRTIGKTQSHGCIRLTNWDATALAAAVSPGTPAILQE